MRVLKAMQVALWNYKLQRNQAITTDAASMQISPKFSPAELFVIMYACLHSSTLLYSLPTVENFISRKPEYMGLI